MSDDDETRAPFLPRRDSLSPAKQAERADLIANASAMRAAGRTYPEIATALGISRSAAIRWVQASIDPTPEDVEPIRARQLAEIDLARRVQLRVIGETLLDPEATTEAATEATAELLKLHEIEARLTGLDQVDPPALAMRSISDEQLMAMVDRWKDEAAG